jgi:hypothetical protein
MLDIRPAATHPRRACSAVACDGQPLVGARSYKAKLPPNIPAELFWSVTPAPAQAAIDGTWKPGDIEKRR